MRYNIGKSIAQAILNSGQKDKELAEYLDCHPTYITYLKSQGSISFKKADVIAEYFGLTLSQFIALGES